MLGQKKFYAVLIHHKHFAGRLDVGYVNSPDLLGARAFLAQWVKQKKIKQSCTSFCEHEFVESLTEIKNRFSGTICDLEDAEDTLLQIADA